MSSTKIQFLSSSSTVFLAAALFVVLPVVATATPVLTKPNSDHRAFVVSSCRNTPYPDVCISTLAHYFNARNASVTFDDHARLARIAILVSLKENQRLATSLTSLSQNATGSAKSSLADCIENIASAGSAVRNSLGKMRLIVRKEARGLNIGALMSDITTSVSSALKSEETCWNGFKKVGDGSSYVETEVRHGVGFVTKVTSNALDLINYDENWIEQPVSLI